MNLTVYRILRKMNPNWKKMKIMEKKVMIHCIR